jgi:hypothetical protein
MGVMVMTKPSKYKSIGVNTDTYEKVVHMAHVERRNISTQLAILVDEAYDKMNLKKSNRPPYRTRKRATAVVGGLSAVMDS